ncbi:ATP-dependent DNA helicase [Hufsiella ginkgonis]|uniref:AAA family ATPase n=1 Tax=Hufsiella ginkgonis TaxID=2695274 RepID=A0A7K1Y144_9SPHI|nr:AAA family ATPase [Hufsiella ginkgonis]MXV16808.1 AAA family ATPase [Hufsiella ginkgonis]
MNVAALLKQHFGLIPSPQQEEAFLKLHRFLETTGGDECFLLRGYAGTGKTTIVSALVKVLPKVRLKTVLLAPTGRAAKVISSYSGRQAFTIHKRIYRKKNAMSPDGGFIAAQNIAENTIFIVDEASMISDDRSDFSTHSLLFDLVSYVYNGKNCRLMLVGDTAQLPPVNSADSPALNRKLLEDKFGLNVFEYELTDVVRQQKTSGILFNATRIRMKMNDEKGFPELKVKGFRDVFRMTGEKLPDGLHYAYDKYGIENTLVVCRSNKSANNYNQQIRNRILYREEELTGGDYIMVVRNNYFWLQDPEKSNVFIANGDIAKVRKVRTETTMYGFRFADVVLEFPDYPDEEPLSCKLMLDTLYMDSPNLPQSDNKRFFDAVMEDYAHLPAKRERYLAMKTDPFYNALQVKFAFAVTCHKAQGGQWEAVFVDQGFLTEDMVDTDFLRWLYTAITRSVKELFLVNFSSQFFEEGSQEAM